MENAVPVTDDIRYMALTCYGEARSESRDGKIAVCHVIKNRAERGGWWGSTIKDVCLWPWQFSAWNEDDPNRKKMLACTTDAAPTPDFQKCLEAAAAVLGGFEADPTGGACHYHAHNIPKPSWAEGKQPCKTIGRHLFYNDID